MNGLRRSAAAVLVTGALVLTGCSDSGGDAASTTTVKKIATTTTTIDPALLGALLDATAPIAQLQTMLGGNLRILNAVITANQISVSVRETLTPANPNGDKNVDSYAFVSGKWTPPRPVPQSVEGIKALDGRQFAPSAVAWSALPALGKQMVEALADLDKPRLTGASISKNASGPPAVAMSVNGLRGSGTLQANGDGTNVVIKRT